MTRLVITGLAAVHLAASVWLGNAHTRLAIDLPAAKTLFVYIVILIAPIVGVDTVYLNRLMGVVYIYAGKLSLWCVSPFFAGVA